MAWRISAYLIEGELDNTYLGKVTGWMQFAGMKDKVTFNLEGDFHRDIRGAKIHFTGDAYEGDAPSDAESGMEGFAPEQTGKVGDITAGLPPVDYVAYPYLEWFGEENGRVVIELEPVQVEVIGTPIPACESDPISREQQNRNMAEFLGSLAADMNLPAERAVCVSGRTVIQGKKQAAKTKMRGTKLLPGNIRKNLPALGAQDGKGGKAVAYIKWFTPSSSFTWYVVEGDPVRDEAGKVVDYTLFGLVDGLEKELGYFRLSEIESVRGPMGLPVERDLYWEPKTLEEIAPELFKSSERTEG